MNARARESERQAARSYLISRIIASVVLGLPSLAAIYGSAASLVHIADVEHLSDPRVLPFCLDLLAIGIVVSAVFCGHDDRLSRLTPWAAYGCSAALQVADVWTDVAGNLQPRAWAVHALPLAAAILGTEKILRLWRPEPVIAPEQAPAGVTPDDPVTRLENEGVEQQTRRPARPSPARRPRSRHPRTSTRPAAVDLELVERLRRTAAEREIAPGDLSQRGWLDVLKAQPAGGVHISKVAAALRHIEETSDAPT
jgi:hypothetical protein